MNYSPDNTTLVNGFEGLFAGIGPAKYDSPDLNFLSYMQVWGLVEIETFILKAARRHGPVGLIRARFTRGDHKGRVVLLHIYDDFSFSTSIEVPNDQLGAALAATRP